MCTLHLLLWDFSSCHFSIIFGILLLYLLQMSKPFQSYFLYCFSYVVLGINNFSNFQFLLFSFLDSLLPYSKIILSRFKIGFPGYNFFLMGDLQEECFIGNKFFHGNPTVTVDGMISCPRCLQYSVIKKHKKFVIFKSIPCVLINVKILWRGYPNFSWLL